MSLKIIAGQARGRTLKTLPQGNLSIRPMLGRMKKSVFDILHPKLEGAYFLDLFAGTGSAGIEALSRGAKKAVFAELNNVSLKLIRQNLEMLGFLDRAQIVRCDALKNFSILKDKYDIVFAGPPYKDKNKKMLSLSCPVLVNIVRFDILKEDSLVVLQRHFTEILPEITGLNLIRTQKYGDTLITFYKRA